MLRAAAEAHPSLAFGVISGRWERVGPLLGTHSERYAVPRMMMGAADGTLLAQLDAFTTARIPPASRHAMVKAEAAIRDRAEQRERRLPELDRWLQEQADRTVAQ
jgi:hypothetical protein